MRNLFSTDPADWPSAWEAMKDYGGFSREELRRAWGGASVSERRSMLVVAVYYGWMDAPNRYLRGLYPGKGEE